MSVDFGRLRNGKILSDRSELDERERHPNDIITRNKMHKYANGLL